MEAISRHIVNHDWVLGILLLLLALMAVMVSSYRALIYKILMATFFKQYYILLQREENEIYRKVSMFLNFISFISIALFFYFLFAKYSWNPVPLGGFYFFLLVFAMVLLTVFLQYGLVSLTGWIFKSENESKEYQFNIFLTYKLFGIFLIPILFFIQYSAGSSPFFFLKIGLFLLAVITVKRYFVGFQLGFSITSFPKIYSFLYICTLELLPLAILFKEYEAEFLMKILGI
ncbi:MAG: DUF4271 domain-containing protein [Bacteroidetes bacterium]|nr:DUF4271 domain-containing protein [Bacteroidota bacterium]